MAQASATPAEAATAVEAEVQRVLSGRGAAGDVLAQAGRSLSDRAGDARRPLSRTLRQLGPPSRNRRPLLALASAPSCGLTLGPTAGGGFRWRVGAVVATAAKPEVRPALAAQRPRRPARPTSPSRFRALRGRSAPPQRRRPANGSALEPPRRRIAAPGPH